MPNSDAYGDTGTALSQLQDRCDWPVAAGPAAKECRCEQEQGERAEASEGNARAKPGHSSYRITPNRNGGQLNSTLLR